MNTLDLCPEDPGQLLMGGIVELLRARLVADRSAKQRLPLPEVLALIIKAWNAYIDRAPMKKLAWASSKSDRARREAFPTVRFKPGMQAVEEPAA